MPEPDNWLPSSDNWLTESDNCLPESDNCAGNTVVVSVLIAFVSAHCIAIKMKLRSCFMI